MLIIICFFVCSALHYPVLYLNCTVVIITPLCLPSLVDSTQYKSKQLLDQELKIIL